LRTRYDAEISKLKTTPMPEDIRRFHRFKEVLGIDAPLYEWLKSSFYVSYARRRDLWLLHNFLAKTEEDVTSYLDHELAESFEKVVTALRSIQHATIHWYFTSS